MKMIIFTSVVLVVCGAVVLAYLSHRKKVSGEFSKLDINGLDLPKGKISQDFFIKVHIFALYGGMNICTKETFTQLFTKVYGSSADFSKIESLSKELKSWEANFPNELKAAGESLSDKDKKTLLSSVYTLALGDGMMSDKEKSFLTNFSQYLGMSDDEINSCLDQTNENLKAA